jgi:tetratricopeptide (TPR) repeat protein
MGTENTAFEHNKRSPAFDELPVIYGALKEAGVRLSLRDRNLFLDLARQQFETKRTHKVQKSPQEWEDLRAKLAVIDKLPDVSSVPFQVGSSRAVPSSRMEISHLVGRESWLDSLYAAIAGRPPLKWMILQGPPGIGKTSELHRIATYFQQHVPRYYVVLCQLPEREREAIGPDMALELLLSDIVEGTGPLHASLPMEGLQARVKYVLDGLAQADRPVLILLDNAEHLLDEQGDLVPTWRQFYKRFVQARHHASLVLATKEWPTQFTLETQWSRPSMVPALSHDEGIVLLQRLGLQDLPEEQLGQVVEAVGGVPVCLEWVSELMRDPLLQGDWSAFEDEDDDAVVSSGKAGRVQRLQHLLEDASLFGGPIATQVTPLLNRVIRRLSAAALAALHDLSVAPLPLGGPALKRLYRDPTPLQELRAASLLAAYRKRVQVLPMVAAQVRQQLSPSSRRLAEDRLIEALKHWLERGIADTREKGVVLTELACLLLRHRRLLAAAELVLYHGWLSFHAGQIRRLARRVQQVRADRPMSSPESDIEAESGALLVHYYLAPYLGEVIVAEQRRADYERMYAWVTTGQLKVEPLMEVHLVDHLMLSQVYEDRYEEAQRLLEGCFARLEPLLPDDVELHATLLSKRASLYSEWSGWGESQGKVEEVKRKRSQSIEAYQESFALLQRAGHREGLSPLQQDTIKKKQATVLNNLSYQLNRAGRFAQALQHIDHCIVLKEQGYADLDSLAASYGEKSQILAALGDFAEALRLDERAREEIGRSADAGDTRSQADRWVYRVNQARLYLLIGRASEAERLLRGILPIKTPRRRIYKVLAEEALREIESARAALPDGRFQLDWRWVRRYRELSAYDAYWWWAPAGPFTGEERQQWEKLFTPGVDEATKDRLREILMQSRDRELSAARASRREPRLSYPALDITEVRRRIVDFLQLDAEIAEGEPNVVVRRLYHGAIEDEICFLRLIEATCEGAGERFWVLTQQLYPPPTSTEMQYALEQVRQVLLHGLKPPGTEVTGEIEQGRRDARREACQQVVEILRYQFHLPLDLSGEPNGDFGGAFSPLPDAPMISAQGAKRFFEAVLQSCGYSGWQVLLDPNVQGPRVEAGLQHIFLPAEPIPLDELREYVSHELIGHVARSIAGESSLLGLLGIGTKGYMSTEEGIADYYERQAAAVHGGPVDDSGIWLGTLAIGLACGVAGPPQTFSSLLAFFEPFLLLYRLRWRDDEDRQIAERRARRNAITRCLRTFRGVPDLVKAGICNTKDVVYLRGRWLIDQAAAQDETVLDRLAVGKVAYELLPELEKLGIPASTPSFRTLVLDPDLDAYIMSFEREGERKET